jgi:2-iminobutanoate/2-iminopropanoate deaminase
MSAQAPLRERLAARRLAEYTRGHIASVFMQERNAEWRSRVNRRISSLVNRSSFAVAALVVGGILTVHGAFSQAAPQASAPAPRRAINLSDDNPQLPFSGAILAGNTLYLSGRIGLDPKTGKAPAEVDEEIKLLLDRVKATLGQAGMSMDDLVYVQIACSDLALYDKFNAAYRSYFTSKDLPAREFIGAGSLLRGGHFELQAIAVRR